MRSTLGGTLRNSVPADGPIRLDPERIIGVLDAHGVECVIVGGFGAQAHGAHRQTLDIDVVPRSTDDNFSVSRQPCASWAPGFASGA